MYEILDAADTEQLFYDTVVRFKGEPVYVHRTEANKLHLRYLKNMENVGIVGPNDPDLDLTPVPLGFVNLFEDITCHLLERTVKRQFRVGMASTNTHARDILTKRVSNISRVSKNVRDTIMRVYPRYWDLLNYFGTVPRGALAFHPFFAMTADNDLYYKLTAIGTINPENGKVLFKKQFKHIQTALEKVEIFSEK